ncbi:type IV toxin-antitoxin system AbiEi family antitoxin domain-containing protein [Acrocarpospora pleiomorpha]|uniref:type IV toxin-antitoxin system AbiEi family antitoxin domain-containing protein n=1 Tax=Acrocarpospora pleiomorpha TaxID=90975 RepID=UPI001478F355|nr:type IV toxin-antitoxin system AbiEi family antitoxin domain-containing protein [Acrocarpospora pleiomorpha]
MDTLFEIAIEHGGLFTTKEARDAGVPYTMLSYHTEHGDLERLMQGVYRLTRFPAGRFEDVIAVTLWAGFDCAASHETALAIYGLADALPGQINITTPSRFRGVRDGVIVHYAPLSASEVWQWENVQVTRPERTLADVARRSDPNLVKQAAKEALDSGLTTRRRLAIFLAEQPDQSHIRRIWRLRLPSLNRNRQEP